MEIQYSVLKANCNSFKFKEKGLFEFELYDMAGSVIDEGKAINELTIGYNLNKGFYIVKIKQKRKVDFISSGKLTSSIPIQKSIFQSDN